MKKLTIFGLMLLLAASCTEENITLPEPQPGEVSDDIEANIYMDEVLCARYLYAEEYASITRNTDMMYDDFLETTLTSMQTNTLDYKNGHLYSFVTREPLSAASLSSRSTVLPDSGISFGFVSFSVTNYTDKLVALGVNGVYKNSVAEEGGITRGCFITHIDDEEITTDNYIELFNKLFSSSASTLKLTFAPSTSALVSSEATELTLTSRETEYNPVLKSEIFDGSVGYLVYSSFIESTARLEEAMATFAAAGVTDLILDLRLNGGGYNDSANTLASCIAGASHTGEIFNKRTHNPSIADAEELFLSVSDNCYLNLPRVYCLVGEGTASASELVINGLEGIDIEVILIGEVTNGKNVGMYNQDFTTDNWSYEFYPICFKSVNAKGWGEYENGFAPNYPADEWSDGANFSDFSQNEILVATAISLINGETPVAPQSLTKSSMSFNKMGIISSKAQFNGSIAVK